MSLHSTVKFILDHPLNQQRKPAESSNPVLLRNLAAVEQRLQQAPAMVVNGRRF